MLASTLPASCSDSRCWRRLGFALSTALVACSELAQEPPSQTFEQRPDLLPPALSDGALSHATPLELRAAIAQHGVDAVVAALLAGDEDKWYRVIERISGGNPDWLALVPLLAPGADGHASESLHIAVSSALRHNAAGVLALISQGAAHPSVCAFGAIEPSQAEVTNYYAAAIPAVEAVSDASLSSVRRTCLESLRHYALRSQ